VARLSPARRRLDAEGLDVPLHLRYAGDAPLIHAAAALGTLLCDGIGDSAIR
jgi:4-hydroxy-3-methylbut-2-en-1-yl diphosphate synthase IspG/GcpE